MFHVGHIQVISRPTVPWQSYNLWVIGKRRRRTNWDIWFDRFAPRPPKVREDQVPVGRGVYLSRSRKGMAFHETSWHGKAFRINGPLWRESIGDRCIPLIKGRYCGLGVVFLQQPSVDDISTKSENRQLQWLQTVFLTCRISCFIWRPALNHVEGKSLQVGSDKHYVGPPWETANDLYRFRMILRRVAISNHHANSSETSVTHGIPLPNVHVACHIRAIRRTKLLPCKRKL